MNPESPRTCKDPNQPIDATAKTVEGGHSERKEARTDQTPTAGLEGTHSVDDRQLAETLIPSSSLRAPTPSILADFGDYEILEEIARGGMGVVYKARQKRLNRIVALKMILAGNLASDVEVKRFFTEAEAAAALEHPGIVPIFEIGEEAGRHFFSMAYVAGQSLQSRLKDGPLPPREAAQMLRLISDAVQYAHAKGIVHRDLKPANVLLDANGEPRVTDFGLAKSVATDSGLTGSGQIMGTPSYMAPEQAAGHSDSVGPVADVYALGAILYEMLTGRPPFRAATVMETLKQVLEQEPASLRVLNQAIPLDLETICQKSLSKSPAARYGTAAELSDELNRYLNHEPIRARRLGIVARASRWCRRKPFVAGLYAAVSVAVMALLVAGASNAHARRVRQVAELDAAFAAGLRNPALAPAYLSQMEATVAAIDALDASRAESARRQLYDTYAAAIRASVARIRLTTSDLREFEAAVQALESREPSRAGELKSAMMQRFSDWTTVVDLHPPFEGYDALFTADEVTQQVDELRPVVPIRTRRINQRDDIAIDVPDQTVFVNFNAGLAAQFEVTFAEGWERASQLGVLLNASPRGEGYHFVLRLPHAHLSRPTDRVGRLLADNVVASESRSESFAEARAAGRPFLVEVFRDGTLLQSATIPATGLPSGSLNVRATREGTKITLQVGQANPVEIVESFARRDPGESRFGIDWPRGVGITSLRIRRKNAPATPSELDVADQAFAERRFSDAWTRYEELARIAADPELAYEARFKEGLSLNALGRTDEAMVVFEASQQAGHPRWAMQAACQLWRLALAKKDTTKADELFRHLSAKYSFQVLASQLPSTEREDIVESYRQRIVWHVDLATPEEAETRQLIAAVDRTLSPDGRGAFLPQWEEARALDAIGKSRASIDAARKLVEHFPEHAHAWTFYARLLRQADEFDLALDVADQILDRARREKHAEVPTYWLERIRTLGCMRRWETAETEVVELMRQVCDPDAHLTDQRRVDILAAAGILHGCLRDRRGQPEAARHAWREASVLCEKWLRSESSGSSDAVVSLSPETTVQLAMLGSFTNSISPADANDLIIGTLGEPRVAKMLYGVLGKDEVLRSTSQAFTLPYCRKQAEDVFVFHRTPRRRRVQVAVAGMLTQYFHEAVFDRQIGDREEAVFALAERIFENMQTIGKLTDSEQLLVGALGRILQLASLWTGTSTPIADYEKAAAAWPREMRALGELVLAHRYRHLNQDADARLLFHAAVADMPTESRWTELVRLDQDLFQKQRGRVTIQQQLGSPVKLVLQATGDQGVTYEWTDGQPPLDLPVGQYRIVASQPIGSSPTDRGPSLPVRIVPDTFTTSPAGRIEVRVERYWRSPSEEQRRTALKGLAPMPAALPELGRWQVCLTHATAANWAAAWSPTGDWLAVSGRDPLVRVYDMRNRKLAYILPGHEGEVFSLAWSPDSRHLASAGTDKVVRIWDLPGGRLGRVLSEYPHPIKQVAWSSDGEWLAAASIEGGGAHWWSMKDDRRRVEALGSPVHSIAWSRDAKRLAAATDDRKVRIWQLDSEQPPLLLNADQSPVIHLAWGPDDRWLAAAEGLSIRVWDTKLWNLKHTFQHTGGIRAIAWSPDGKSLVSCPNEGVITVWDTEHFADAPRVRSPITGQSCVAWSPDGSQFATSGGNAAITLWNAEGQRGGELGRWSRSIYDLDWRPDGSLLAVAVGDGTIRVMTPSGATATAITRQPGDVYRACWSPDGQRLAATSGLNVALWKPTGELTELFRGHTNGIFAIGWLDDQRLVSGGQYEAVRLWSADGQQSRTLGTSASRWMALSAKKDGEIAAADGLEQILRWNARGESLPGWNPKTYVTCVAWRPQGDLLAVSGADHLVRLLRADGQVAKSLKGHGNVTLWVAWSPDGKLLASAGRDGKVLIWSDSGQLKKTLIAPFGSVERLAWRADNRTLVSTGNTPQFQTWDATTGDLRSITVLLPEPHAVTMTPWGEITQASGPVDDELTYLIETPEGGLELATPTSFYQRLRLPFPAGN